MNLNTRILRFMVKRRQKSTKNELKKALKNLTVEQILLFNKVKDLAVTNNSAIRFDIKTDETLIDLPHILIIIKGCKVYVQNTNSFHLEEFPSDTIELLMKTIVRESHRDRCKIKHQGKMRIRSLINNIGEQVPCPENQEQQ